MGPGADDAGPRGPRPRRESLDTAAGVPPPPEGRPRPGPPTPDARGGTIAPPKAPLIVRYRPATWADVVGQERVVASMRSALKRGDSKAFLLVGPSGCGKTTLARIAAASLRCAPANVREIDAATHNDVNFWRTMTDELRYGVIGSALPGKSVIVDECHTLSKQSWDALLKPIEDAPRHVHWFFNTTAAGKVPATIASRCVKYELSPVSMEDIEGVLRDVCAKEGGGPPPEVLELIARAANGSPREALVKLAACWRTTEVEDVNALLRNLGEATEDVINICRGLVKQSLSFQEARRILSKIEAANAEGMRRQTRAYFLKVALSRGDESSLAILSAFATPYPPDADIGYYLTDLAGLLLGGNND